MESICESSNNDLERLFDLRKKLYEQRSDLLDIEIESHQLIPEDIKNELNEINESVSKGQKLLENELLNYKKLTKEKQDLETFENTGKSTCLECQKKISDLLIHFENQNFSTTELRNIVDEVIYCIGQIFEILEQQVKDRRETISEKIQMNTSMLKYLSNVYKVLRGTNIGYICPICMNNEVNVFCDPCGHSFCDKCINVSYCYMCKRRINSIKKLYFS
jgi:hypothetical protein